MRRIAIVGASGSGKSTLAVTLHRMLRLPLYHLDSLYWGPGWTRMPKEEWANLQRALVEKPEWIIDGNYNSTLDIRLGAADTVIFLNFSRLRCIAGVLRRYIRQARVDDIPGCPEKIDIDFLRWVWNYRRKNTPRMLRALERLPPTTVVHVLENRRELSRLVEQLK